MAEYILYAAYRARQSLSRSPSYPLHASRKFLPRQDNKSIRPAELALQSAYMQRTPRL